MVSGVIRNPVLKGFNPDPSICRKGNDFYIATSTFEWFPGVQIHHSRDLVHWQLLTRPLNRVSQLDLRGVNCSGGVWAPCLSFADGLFWLVYTNVTTLPMPAENGINPIGDWHNFLVTAENPEGPWSEPVYLNSVSFDPSLFHDDDGRKWLLYLDWDWTDRQRGRQLFNGILIREYDATRQRLIGPEKKIFSGTDLGCTEGPHLYKQNGFYWLMTAEGGTGYTHAVTLARSEKLEGPYKVHPDNPLLTSAGDESLELQKAGHGSWVDTPNGEWFLAHLCGRPIGEKRCVLGRETALQKLEWCADGWPRIIGGSNRPSVVVPAPALEPHPFEPEPARDDFDGLELSPHFQTLRVPFDESWGSLSARPGWLRLKGRESLGSRFDQSLIARRIDDFVFTAETRVDCAPESERQMAGLTAYYNTYNWFYLCVRGDHDGSRVLELIECDNSSVRFCLSEPLSVSDGPVALRLKMDRETMTFEWRPEDGAWQRIGSELDATHLSDEYGKNLSFTGAFVGLCAQDLFDRTFHADFDYFDYKAEKV
jgi:xylan 1,4-beta-xylosidase